MRNIEKTAQEIEETPEDELVYFGEISEQNVQISVLIDIVLHPVACILERKALV